ncbi:MAG: ABC transporter substrate-binding protein [Candidatus Omnitrophica bacterium]|nr:ABC transporter substrate-binding protein [Candidatus Omnitrophota bacterium]
MRRLFITSLFSICLAHLCFAGDDYPKRIVSLGSALTEELYILGAEDRLVGVTIYCERPPRAKEKEKVGNVVKVDLEKILSLKPDLVLATSLTDSRSKEKLKNLNIKVAEFTYAKNFSQICNDFLRLGRLVGNEKEAKGIVLKAKKRVEFIRDKVKDLPKHKVFVQIGAKPLHTVTKDSFINDFIEFAGGINVARVSRSGLYSREEVLKNNPDVIIIATMGIVGQNEKRSWQKLTTMEAVKNDRIYIVDAYKICSPTPVSFVEALEEITNLLHPDLDRR